MSAASKGTHHKWHYKLYDNPRKSSLIVKNTTDRSQDPSFSLPSQNNYYSHQTPMRNTLNQVHEISAGGLVIDDIYKPLDQQVGALIGRTDRRGHLLWSLPKGHIEPGETTLQAAVREITEETGLHSHALAALGTVDYWFVTNKHQVHKTVYHYLMEFRGGQLCTDDIEVSEVAWVPLTELSSRLTYPDEQRLISVAQEIIHLLQMDGPENLPSLPKNLQEFRTHILSQKYSRLLHHSQQNTKNSPRSDS